MWNPPEDVTVVTTTRRRGWFPFPTCNGVPERLEKLETWKKSPRHQLFSKTWARANALEFFNDYEQLILSAVQKLWKNRPRLWMASSVSSTPGEAEAGSAEEDTPSVPETKYTHKHKDVEVMSGNVTFGAEFKFNRNNSGHAGSTFQEQCNFEYTKALLYYLKEVCVPALFEELCLWRTGFDDPEEICWKDALDVLLAAEESADPGELALDSITELVCKTRKPSGCSHRAWCITIALYRKVLSALPCKGREGW